MVKNKSYMERQNLKVPERYTLPRAVMTAAQKPITDDMTYGEVKEILRAQKRLQTEFAKAALHHIKETTGRNLTAESVQWKGHTVKVTGKTITGKVTVTQFQYDDKAPGQEIGKWEYSKRTLLNKYYKENQK